MKNNFTLRWTIANALAMSIGFLAALQFLMFYAHGLDFEKHWVFGEPEDMSDTARTVVIGIALLIFGIIFSFGQVLVLKQYLEKPRLWILTGPSGYVLVLLIIAPFIGIWGGIPGPVEPLAITLGGTFFMIAFQWIFLKKQGIAPARPILCFALGLVAGVLPLVVLFGFIWNPPWGADIALMGLSMGGCAGFLSARHFQKVLEERNI